MRTERTVTGKISAERECLAKNASKLQALSPLNVIARGYTVATDENGKVVTSIKNVENGSVIELSVSDGKIISRVTEVVIG